MIKILFWFFVYSALGILCGSLVAFFGIVKGQRPSLSLWNLVRTVIVMWPLTIVFIVCMTLMDAMVEISLFLGLYLSSFLRDRGEGDGDSSDFVDDDADVA